MSEQSAEPTPVPNGTVELNWEAREKLLLAKITLLELSIASEKQNHKDDIRKLQEEIQAKAEEHIILTSRLQLLETELTELKNQKPDTLSPSQASQVEKVKQMSEEMLTKAKGVIFDKTKICKNQELQIEALNAQVFSLKEVLGITKDLLEIRNLEVHHLEEKMNCMDAKISAERERRDLMDKKLEAMLQLNTDLKDEYKIQLRIFNALKTKYDQKDGLQNQNGGGEDSNPPTE